MSNSDYFHILKIKITDECPNRESVVEYYNSIEGKLLHKGESGVDLIFPEDINLRIGCVTQIDLGIQCEMISEKMYKIKDKNAVLGRYMCYSEQGTSEGFMLVPKSSISLTPLCMANSIGIIDHFYRSEINVPVRCFDDMNHAPLVDNKLSDVLTSDKKYTVKQNQSLFQIVAFDGKHIKVEVVSKFSDMLSKTGKGENAFGSTNNNNTKLS